MRGRLECPSPESAKVADVFHSGECANGGRAGGRGGSANARLQGVSGISTRRRFRVLTSSPGLKIDGAISPTERQPVHLSELAGAFADSRSARFFCLLASPPGGGFLYDPLTAPRQTLLSPPRTVHAGANLPRGPSEILLRRSSFFFYPASGFRSAPKNPMVRPINGYEPSPGPIFIFTVRPKSRVSPQRPMHNKKGAVLVERRWCIYLHVRRRVLL